uniref:Uncharacterized protein n=1 Tax=Arundo donax TaxID=35708 RepID=A0A0A9FF67_ARUDO
MQYHLHRLHKPEWHQQKHRIWKEHQYHSPHPKQPCLKLDLGDA